MAEATFEVGHERRAERRRGPLDRFGAAGGDSVEFLIGPNPGVPAGPLREIASGGELSRVMLALMSVATSAEGSPTVVFDEVDAGVGGATARAVGEKAAGARRPGARWSASPTCRRSPRWPRAISGS